MNLSGSVQPVKQTATTTLNKMSIYRIHPDRLNYQILTISADEVEDKLGEECLFHIHPEAITTIIYGNH